MTAPWTPRERALREALEGVMELAKEWSSAASSLGHPLSGASARSAADEAEEALEAHIAAALADQPPPDPRDEALDAVEVVLDTIVTRLENVDYGTVIIAQSGLAAIAAAQGEK